LYSGGAVISFFANSSGFALSAELAVHPCVAIIATPDISKPCAVTILSLRTRILFTTLGCFGAIKPKRTFMQL
jgi:hypothetical protein